MELIATLFGLLLAAAFLVPLFMIGMAIATSVFWIAMIVRVAQLEHGEDKTTWIIVVVFLHFVGALVYWFVRGRQHYEARNDLRNIFGFSAVMVFGLCACLFTPTIPIPSIGAWGNTAGPEPRQLTITALLESQRQTSTAFYFPAVQDRTSQPLTAQQAATLAALDKTKTTINQTGTALHLTSTAALMGITKTVESINATSTALQFSETPTPKNQTPSRTPTRTPTQTRTRTPTPTKKP
jgi:cytochrome bd-type quinol oxidase subunit 2